MLKIELIDALFISLAFAPLSLLRLCQGWLFVTKMGCETCHSVRLELIKALTY